ncbi:Aste57867_18277 [Aphanomyces stellatus]|uniref:Aste57867_18277 protein n=1 Tax=Aphanomyces stellatus TaxID=120398 RepID=A0A485L9M9_9STRA|nr:hypothetical protein As57867_018215 [Aphanomyces stellatus]VFT95014.1 Aste57867_18277 [Aphanomyces stellatus]
MAARAVSLRQGKKRRRHPGLMEHDDDLLKFIHGVETSAKKILKDHSKRVHDEAARERVEKTRPKPVDEKTSISRDELKSKYGALIIPAPKDKPPDDGGMQMPSLHKPSSIQVHPTTCDTTAPTSLPSLKRHKQDLRDRAAVKLLNSPLYKGLTKTSGTSPTAFKAALAQLDAVDDLRTLGLGGKPNHHRHEHNVERRMCNACWAEPTKNTRCEHSYRGGPGEMELQGATSWSSDDIHFKYRAEREREAAWVASTTLQATDSPVVPILERHPLYDKYFHTVETDNTYVQNLSRAKNQTKQFVLDVNRVWLTNLDHFNTMLGHDVSPSTKGLRGRHDLGAIRQGYSQIQSVSMACALKNTILPSATNDGEAATSLTEPPPPRKPLRLATDGLDTEFTPLSILACGRLDWRGKVPGTVVLSTFPGLWWCTFEFTRPAAMFIRDVKLSSTNTILVTLVLALDSPVLAPTWFAWIPGSVSAPVETDILEPFLTIPLLAVACHAPPSVVSPLDDFLPSTICIPNGCSDDIPDMPMFNAINFRQYLRWSTVRPNFDLDAKAYGIVQGYTNQTGLNGRFSWHSEEADYAVHARNLIVRGGNDPNMYTLNMRHEAVEKISTSGLHSFLAAQEKIREEARLKAQMLEIETKLQAGRLALDAKRAEKRRLELEAQKQAEVRAKMLEGIAAMPERTVGEWKERVAQSHVVREWNGWEEREHTESHVLFYHHSNVALERASSWAPPDGWPSEAEWTGPATENVDEYDDDDASTVDGMGKEDMPSKAATDDADESVDKMAHALAESEAFLRLLQEKLGLPPPRSTKRRRSSVRQPTKDDSSEEDDESDDEDTVAGRVLRILAQDESTAETNSASVKRLTRLQILKEAPQNKPVSPGEGWKRLKPTRLPKSFAKRVYSTTIAGPRAAFINQPNLPLIVGLIDPGKTASYDQPEVVPDFREHFVPDLEAEMTTMKKVLAATAKKATRQTIMEVFKGTTADDEEEAVSEETEADRIAKAVLYARNNNVKELEGMLDEGVNINARDENGNTLFILSCQQGNKNMCKFLMRRRCDMDLQNFRGNTGLHYCYEYKWTELATYLKDKGAKDDIANADGLMCYEGINAEHLATL